MQTRVIVDRGENDSSFAINDRIFLGEGLFETLRVEHSQPLFANLHWQRLSHSALQLGIFFDLSFDDWLVCLLDQIRRDHLDHGGIKAILSGGPAPRGLAQYGQASQLIFQTFHYTAQSDPVSLMSIPWLRDATNPVYQLKTVNYLEAIIARRQALANEVDDALFYNTQHHVTETTCANLFIIQDNQVVTPPLTDGVLPGIMRSRVQSICEHLKISCKEHSLTKSMVENADAVFITNALQGIRCVSALDDVDLKTGHPLIEQLSFFLFEVF